MGNRKGISLIELVLTLALVSIVLQVVYSMFFVGNTSYSISTNKGFSQQDVRIAGDLILSELKYITDISSTNMYTDEYYSIKIDYIDGKKFLTKTLHKYTGDGSEPDKETLTTNTVISKIAGNWNTFTITNTTLGEIDILIKQEEGQGNQKSGYELPLKMQTINNNVLLTNINGLDLASGGVLYYRNDSENLLTRGIDIVNTTPVGGETGMYIIRFFTSLDSTDPYNTITGNNGQEKNMPSAPTKSGFYFTGWNTKSDGSGEQYIGNFITIPSYNMDLYAIWSTTEPIVGNLNNLSVESVTDTKGIVTGSNNTYSVVKKKNVEIVLKYSYNKPTTNLEIIGTGFNGTISGTANKAIINIEAPDKDIKKEIIIEVREKFNKNISDKIKIVLLGVNN